MGLTKVRGKGLGTLGDGTASDTSIIFDGNAQDYHIGLDDSSDSLTIGLGSALGTTSHMVFDATGAITKPLQPAFLADLTSRMSDLATNSTATVQFNSEKFDVNGDFNTSNYTFTAPVTGKYQLNFNAYLTHVQNDADYYYFQIDTSNRNYIHIFDPRGYDQDLGFANAQLSVLADMDASDTAKVLFYQINGTAALDIIEGDTNTYFSGHLVC